MYAIRIHVGYVQIYVMWWSLRVCVHVCVICKSYLHYFTIYYHFISVAHARAWLHHRLPIHLHTPVDHETHLYDRTKRMRVNWQGWAFNSVSSCTQGHLQVRLSHRIPPRAQTGRCNQFGHHLATLPRHVAAQRSQAQVR